MRLQPCRSHSVSFVSATPGFIQGRGDSRSPLRGVNMRIMTPQHVTAPLPLHARTPTPSRPLSPLPTFCPIQVQHHQDPPPQEWTTPPLVKAAGIALHLLWRMFQMIQLLPICNTKPLDPARLTMQAP